MSKFTPYLGFNGNCREAMTFYQGCFGGELVMQPVGETPVCDQMPPDAKDKIMHSSLTAGDVLLMATDMHMDGGYTVGGNVSIAVECKSEEEIDRYFACLSEGGTVICPLAPSFWGIKFGMVIDKYGTDWCLDYSGK